MNDIIYQHKLKIDEYKHHISLLHSKISTLSNNDSVKKMGTTFCMTQIEKNRLHIIELKDKIEEWNLKLKYLEDETSEYYQTQMNLIQEQTIEHRHIEQHKRNIKKQMKQPTTTETKTDESVPKLSYKERKKIKKQERNRKQKKIAQYNTDDFKRDFQLEIYWDTTRTLPEYMYNNLLKLPNNYGYIWKRTWFLGRLPPDSSTNRFMFERQRDNSYRIHEYYNSSYKSYIRKDINPFIHKYIRLKQ